jgi:hypothetical protein
VWIHWCAARLALPRCGDGDLRCALLLPTGRVGAVPAHRNAVHTVHAAAPAAMARFACARGHGLIFARPAVANRYLQVFRKLEESYDQMVHPQKRMDIRKVRSHSCSLLRYRRE